MRIPFLMAYLDPGTGSLLAQAIVGGIIAALATLRIYGKNIRNFFGGFFRKTNQPSDPPASHEE